VVSRSSSVDERAFELAVCACLEREGYVVGRQLGAGRRRVLDVLAVEPGPAFEERARITDRSIPIEAIEADAGPGRARRPGEALSCHPGRIDEVVDRAVAAGFFERERRDGREYVRQTIRYPAEWFGRLVAVENKPDLSRPGDLELQLRKDTSLAVADAVVLATASHVTGAHLNRLPDDVGVWRVDPADGSHTVVREPAALPVEEAGLDVLSDGPARWDVRPVGADGKARLRRRLAERAYGKGWRDRFPACTRVRDPRAAGVPYCPWKGRVVAPEADCGASCAGHDPADPPGVDLPAARDRASPWVSDPPGVVRRQADLRRFVDEE
jgi:hypothetical protein